MQDVLAVNLKTKQVRLLTEQPQTPDNAEAFVMMAVIRLGVEEEFFVAVEAGTYREDETYRGQKVPRRVGTRHTVDQDISKEEHRALPND